MNKCRVLLVEDHATVREGLKALINLQPDMEVVGEAADGGDAIQRTQQLSPDVVVLDLSMPGVTGLQAIEAIRRTCPRARLLALTRHSAAGYLQQVLHSGGAGYVLKQSSADEFLEGIRAVAAGRKFLDRTVTTHVVEEQVRRRSATPDAHPALSAREEEVLRLIAHGYSNKESAARLGLSVKTIETHKANAMQKLGMSSRIDLVRFAYLEGWFEQDH